MRSFSGLAGSLLSVSDPSQRVRAGQKGRGSAGVPAWFAHSDRWVPFLNSQPFGVFDFPLVDKAMLELWRLNQAAHKCPGGLLLYLYLNVWTLWKSLDRCGHLLDIYCASEDPAGFFLMPGFTKLFNSILASSIWSEDDKTRLVWITMLAMANEFGVVEASVIGLAHQAHVAKEDCQKALEKLLAPDSDSRSKEFEGRRIEQVDGGWKILNHGKYRHKMSLDERREYYRLKKREYRLKEREANRGLSAREIINNTIAAEQSLES